MDNGGNPNATKGEVFGCEEFMFAGEHVELVHDNNNWCDDLDCRALMCYCNLMRGTVVREV